MDDNAEEIDEFDEKGDLEDLKSHIINRLKEVKDFKECNVDFINNFEKLFNTIMAYPESDIKFKNNTLYVKYQYEKAIRQEVNILLDAAGLYDSINVIYES